MAAVTVGGWKWGICRGGTAASLLYFHSASLPHAFASTHVLASACTPILFFFFFFFFFFAAPFFLRAEWNRMAGVKR
jgi:hypothetical protein